MDCRRGSGLHFQVAEKGVFRGCTTFYNLVVVTHVLSVFERCEPSAPSMILTCARMARASLSSRPAAHSFHRSMKRLSAFTWSLRGHWVFLFLLKLKIAGLPKIYAPTSLSSGWGNAKSRDWTDEKYKIAIGKVRIEHGRSGTGWLFLEVLRRKRLSRIQLG
jgi:hypothetical protein